MMVERAFVLINIDDHIDDDMVLAQLRKIEVFLKRTRYLEFIIFS